MNKFISYIRNSFTEVKEEVSWPKYGELQTSTVLVVVASIMFAFFVGVVDWALKILVQFVY